MSAFQIWSVLFCVCLISLGQILFKYVGMLSAAEANGLNIRAIVFGAVALGIYGLATLVWIYLLRSIPLSKAYPFMALSFVLVPLAAVVFYAEAVNAAYVAGLVLIISGIFVIARFS